MIDAGQHELQRAALRADDEVDSGGLADEPLLELVRKEDHERDRRHAEREQRDVERRGQRTAPGIGEGQAEDVHASAPAGRAGIGPRRQLVRVRQPRTHARVVRSDHERGAARLALRAQQIERRGGVRVVEIRGGLVGQHQRRAIDECARDRDALRLPLRQLARIPPREIGDTDGLEQGSGAAGVVRNAREVLRQPQVVGDVERADEVKPLWHEADIASAPAIARGTGQPAEIGAADDHGPRRRRRQRGEYVQERRLAAAGRAGQQPVLAGLGPPTVDAQYRLSP